jgi:hypothetical protein
VLAGRGQEREQRQAPRLRGGAAQALPVALQEQPAERIQA